MGCSWSPTRPKRSAFSRKLKIAQNPAPCSASVARRQLGRVPAHVDAGRDDRQHAGGADRRRREKSEVAGEKRERDLERRIEQSPAHETDHVADDEPDGDAADDATRRSCALASRSEKVPVTAAATANLNSTSAVPSLTRLSPSMMATARRGTPNRRATAVAAIGSVGETTAPSTKAGAQERPMT